MPMYRVSCEAYDMAWYVRARSARKAESLINDFTEDMGWHKDLPEDEKIIFDVNPVFTLDNTFAEVRDM